VRSHVALWERRARRISDAQLRRIALEALQDKRSNIEGAAAFATFVPRRRRAQATLALSSFQAAYNLLDMLGEQPSPDPVADGRRLHEALLHALREDPRALPRDWYEHHPHRDDGGYLEGLLAECHEALAGLPSYPVAAPFATRAAGRIVAFQSLNLSESQGDHAALAQWAHTATPAGSGLQWWETAAAAGSSLAVYALIAAAAQPALHPREAEALERAYFPWIGGLHSLLDNLIDKREDEAAGHRSLVEYYSPQRAAQRMRWLAERASDAALELPASNRHRVLLAGMIASYLSAPQARAAQLQPLGEAVREAGGPLMRPALLVFGLHRAALAVSRRAGGRTPLPRSAPGPSARSSSAPSAEGAMTRLDNFG
jgi:tetraprenyl-beta-curcumene synthase